MTVPILWLRRRLCSFIAYRVYALLLSSIDCVLPLCNPSQKALRASCVRSTDRPHRPFPTNERCAPNQHLDRPTCSSSSNYSCLLQFWPSLGWLAPGSAEQGASLLWLGCSRSGQSISHAPALRLESLRGTEPAKISHISFDGPNHYPEALRASYSPLDKSRGCSRIWHANLSSVQSGLC